ncbi:MAG: hypothetical protein ACRC5A_02045 [Enterobacteriaceae bacterium]
MKKNALAINIVMIVIGIIGLFFYLNSSQTPAPSPQAEVAPPPPPAPAPAQVSVTVAIASRALPAGTILQQEDYQLQTTRVLADSDEKKQFDLADMNPHQWVLKSPVAQQSYIPRSALVEPGSDEYLLLTRQAGSLLYPLNIAPEDEYLLFNLKNGQYVDIICRYLSS